MLAILNWFILPMYSNFSYTWPFEIYCIPDRDIQRKHFKPLQSEIYNWYEKSQIICDNWDLKMPHNCPFDFLGFACSSSSNLSILLLSPGVNTAWWKCYKILQGAKSHTGTKAILKLHLNRHFSYSWLGFDKIVSNNLFSKLFECIYLIELNEETFR